MEADFERKQIEIKRKIHSAMKAQMENQFQEKVPAIHGEKSCKDKVKQMTLLVFKLGDPCTKYEKRIGDYATLAR
ncbi:hypothetical protein LguiA_013427 [Lonicera macranthoides]